MGFTIDRNAIKQGDRLGGSPFVVTKSDTVPCIGANGCYPRGFQVVTGGTITVWVDDPANPGQTKKRNLVTVPDGWTWTWGGIYGICSTNESGSATTCDNILAIP